MNKIRALTIPAAVGWSKHAKFDPYEIVTFSAHESYIGRGINKKQFKYNNQDGIVVGVSCTQDNLIRGMSKYNYPRCFTRYYVRFEDGYVTGIHSHLLKSKRPDKTGLLIHKKTDQVIAINRNNGTHGTIVFDNDPMKIGLPVFDVDGKYNGYKIYVGEVILSNHYCLENN